MTDERHAYESALKAFDFEEAAHVYRTLSWEWFRVGVPSPTELKSTARSLCESLAADPGAHFVSTGGLRVEWRATYPDRRYVVISVVPCEAHGESVLVKS